jgi:hypothetical protein
MSPSVTPAIIQRIRKLRELSRKNDNEHEAAAAAAAAEKLLSEHQIEEAELEVEEGPMGGELIEERAASEGPRLVYWKSYLLGAIGKLHGCSHCYEHVKGKAGKGPPKYTPLLYGRPEDVAIVKELYAWLVSEIQRLTDRVGRGRGREWRDSYRMGCQYGIAHAMKAAQREARVQATSTALAVIDARLVKAQAALRDRYPDTRDVSRDHETVDGEAFERGHSDGVALHSRAPIQQRPALK